jgi:pyrimidine deaminase RibD-like protein
MRSTAGLAAGGPGAQGLAMTQDAEDQAYMQRAIALAATHLGRTGANPSVGCVIVKDGVVMGEAVTALGGRPHAEEQALAQVGDRARGATAYVTLEPCGARSGGTASCSERLAAAGVARVVVACEDPSTFASGLGSRRLRDAGIGYEAGFLAAQAQGLYADYQPTKRGGSDER